MTHKEKRYLFKNWYLRWACQYTFMTHKEKRHLFKNWHLRFMTHKEKRYSFKNWYLMLACQYVFMTHKEKIYLIKNWYLIWGCQLLFTEKNSPGVKIGVLESITQLFLYLKTGSVRMMQQSIREVPTPPPGPAPRALAFCF